MKVAGQSARPAGDLTELARMLQAGGEFADVEFKVFTIRDKAAVLFSGDINDLFQH